MRKDHTWLRQHPSHRNLCHTDALLLRDFLDPEEKSLDEDLTAKLLTS